MSVGGTAATGSEYISPVPLILMGGSGGGNAFGRSHTTHYINGGASRSCDCVGACTWPREGLWLREPVPGFPEAAEPTSEAIELFDRRENMIYERQWIQAAGSASESEERMLASARINAPPPDLQSPRRRWWQIRKTR